MRGFVRMPALDASKATPDQGDCFKLRKNGLSEAEPERRAAEIARPDVNDHGVGRHNKVGDGKRGARIARIARIKRLRIPRVLSAGIDQIQRVRDKRAEHARRLIKDHATAGVGPAEKPGVVVGVVELDGYIRARRRHGQRQRAAARGCDGARGGCGRW